MRARTSIALGLLALTPVLASAADEKPSSPGFFSVDRLFRTAEERIAGELARRLGPAASYEVRLNREGTRIGEGRLGPLEILGVDVETRGGLTISRLEGRLEGARLGPDLKSLAGDLDGAFTAFVSAPHLTRFARRQVGKRMDDVRVRFRRDELVLQGRPELLLGIGVSSEVTGCPVVRRQGRVLAFRPTGLRVAGLNVPDRARDAVADRITLAIDLGEFDPALRLQHTAVTRDYLELQGTLHIDADELNTPSGSPQRVDAR